MPITRESRIHVRLKVYKPLRMYPGRPNDYFVAVICTGIQLVNNEPDIAPRCKHTGSYVWVKDIWLPKDTAISFHYLVVKSLTNVIVDMETILPHRLYVKGKSVIIESTWNKTRVAVNEDLHKFDLGQKYNMVKDDIEAAVEEAIVGTVTDSTSYTVVAVDSNNRYFNGVNKYVLAAALVVAAGAACFAYFKK